MIPHWPALAFPTRPLSVDEIALVAPEILRKPALYRRLIMVLRGAKVPSFSNLSIESPHFSNRGAISLFVPGKRRVSVKLAITSYKTTNEQWDSAARSTPDRSWSRYRQFNSLVNRILQEQPRPDYIVFPELSIPLRWSLRIMTISKHNVSLLAGVEYHRDRITSALRNDCLVSLVTDWPGYSSHLVWLQSKFAPAHEEKTNLQRLNAQLHVPEGIYAEPTVYVHEGYCFSV